jgi:hypothetical protein
MKGIDFFSRIYMAQDHNSGYRDFYTLFQTLTLWNAACHHVYTALDDNDRPFGVLHGSYTEGDFSGDFYFFEGCRGKMALEALRLTIDKIKSEMNVKRFFADIMEHNKPARFIVSAAGFKRIEKEKFLLEV